MGEYICSVYAVITQYHYALCTQYTVHSTKYKLQTASGNGWTAKVTFAGASRSLGKFTNHQDAQDAYDKEAMLAERDAHIRSSGGPGIHRPCAQKPSTGTKRERKEREREKTCN
jgi:hypothetical protein